MGFKAGLQVGSMLKPQQMGTAAAARQYNPKPRVRINSAFSTLCLPLLHLSRADDKPLLGHVDLSGTSPSGVGLCTQQCRGDWRCEAAAFGGMQNCVVAGSCGITVIL